MKVPAGERQILGREFSLHQEGLVNPRSNVFPSLRVTEALDSWPKLHKDLSPPSPGPWTSTPTSTCVLVLSRSLARVGLILSFSLVPAVLLALAGP